MITEVAAKAAEVISNAAHAVGEAAKAGIEHVQQTAECDVNELKVNRTFTSKKPHSRNLRRLTHRLLKR